MHFKCISSTVDASDSFLCEFCMFALALWTHIEKFPTHKNRPSSICPWKWKAYHTHSRFCFAINRKIYFKSALSEKLQYCTYKKVFIFWKSESRLFVHEAHKFTSQSVFAFTLEVHSRVFSIFYKVHPTTTLAVPCHNCNFRSVALNEKCMSWQFFVAEFYRNFTSINFHFWTLFFEAAYFSPTAYCPLAWITQKDTYKNIRRGWIMKFLRVVGNDCDKKKLWRLSRRLKRVWMKFHVIKRLENYL